MKKVKLLVPICTIVLTYLLCFSAFAEAREDCFPPADTTFYEVGSEFSPLIGPEVNNLMDLLINLEDFFGYYAGLEIQKRDLEDLADACEDICRVFELGPFIVKNPFGTGFGWKFKWLELIQNAAVIELKDWLENTECEDGCTKAGASFPYLNVDIVPVDTISGSCSSKGNRHSISPMSVKKRGLSCESDAAGEFMKKIRAIQESACAEDCGSIVFLSNVKSYYVEPKTGPFDKCTYVIKADVIVICTDKAVDDLYEVTIFGEACVLCSNPVGTQPSLNSNGMLLKD